MGGGIVQINGSFQLFLSSGMIAQRAKQYPPRSSCLCMFLRTICMVKRLIRALRNQRCCEVIRGRLVEILVTFSSSLDDKAFHFLRRPKTSGPSISRDKR